MREARRVLFQVGARDADAPWLFAFDLDLGFRS
jgi:hypothetical protein